MRPRGLTQVAYVAPGHWTGEPTFAALVKAFTDRYLYAGVGTTFALGATPRATASAGRNGPARLEEDDLRGYRALFTTSDDHRQARLGHAKNCCGHA
jgi:7,8-dihydropterin-6-yl-methyl-4-(beta-D-ribofuranosyl)aminobenzene 5'-phosphate synthase